MHDESVFRLDDDVLQFLDAREIAFHLHASTHAIHQKVATRNGHVLCRNGAGDVVEAHLHGFCAQVVDLDFHLEVADALDVDFADLGQSFHLVFQILCVLLEVLQTVVAA